MKGTSPLGWGGGGGGWGGGITAFMCVFFIETVFERGHHEKGNYLEQISKFKDWVFESRSGPVC